MINASAPRDRAYARADSPVDLRACNRQSTRAPPLATWKQHKDAADTLAILIASWGYRALVAYDGNSALRLARKAAPPAIFLDLAMPKISGVRVSSKLRQLPELRRTKLVALTGYTDSYHAKLAKESGFYRYLHKPAELDEIKSVLDSSCSSA